MVILFILLELFFLGLFILTFGRLGCSVWIGDYVNGWRVGRREGGVVGNWVSGCYAGWVLREAE